jgi:hypothetical protein
MVSNIFHAPSATITGRQAPHELPELPANFNRLERQQIDVPAGSFCSKWEEIQRSEAAIYGGN